MSFIIMTLFFLFQSAVSTDLKKGDCVQDINECIGTILEKDSEGHYRVLITDGTKTEHGVPQRQVKAPGSEWTKLDGAKCQGGAPEEQCTKRMFKKDEIACCCCETTICGFGAENYAGGCTGDKCRKIAEASAIDGSEVTGTKCMNEGCSENDRSDKGNKDVMLSFEIKREETISNCCKTKCKGATSAVPVSNRGVAANAISKGITLTVAAAAMVTHYASV